MVGYRTSGFQGRQILFSRRGIIRGDYSLIHEGDAYVGDHARQPREGHECVDGAG